MLLGACISVPINVDSSRVLKSKKGDGPDDALYGAPDLLCTKPCSSRALILRAEFHPFPEARSRVSIVCVEPGGPGGVSTKAMGEEGILPELRCAPIRDRIGRQRKARLRALFCNCCEGSGTPPCWKMYLQYRPFLPRGRVGEGKGEGC